MHVMKKNLSFAFAVMSFAALTMFSSCQKDETVVTRFEATIANISGNSKTVLDGLNLYWVPGDRIKVYDASNNIGVYESTDPAKTSPFDLVNGRVVENSTYRAIYPASAGDNAGHLVLPLDQRTTDGSLTEFPMYAESRTAEPALEFDNLCGVICFKLQEQEQGVSVSSIEVTTDKQLTGTFTISNNDGLSLTGSTSGSNSVTLTCSTPQSISSQKSFYMYVPANEFKFMRIRIYSNDGHVCTKTLKAGTTFIVERGKITPLTLNSDKLDFSSVAGELPGLFSIAEGVQVRFSSGNMQYTTVGTHAVAKGGTADGTWRFAPNQYDYIGKDNENISETYTGWIDLFGWATSGWNGLGEGKKYKPYHWGGMSGALYGPTGEFNIDVTGNYANADWAVYNAISNGGNAPGMWRNLSKDEWMYVTTNRPDASDKLGTGTVNGVGGLILLPDSWTLPAGCTFTPGYSNDQSSWDPNHYTVAQWAMMEAAGAVFLPAAGYRVGSSVDVTNIGKGGYYWSTTAFSEFNAVNARVMTIKPGGQGNTADYDDYSVRNRGFSVRPVRYVH